MANGEGQKNQQSGEQPTHVLWGPVMQSLTRFQASQSPENLQAYRIAAKAFDSRRDELVAELKTMYYSDELKELGL